MMTWRGIFLAFGILSAATSAHAVEAGRDAQGACLRALGALAADAMPDSKDFTPVACPREKLAPAFQYIRGQGSRIARPLAKDDVVSRFPEFGQDTIRPGQSLRILVQAGPVRVEHTVVAMQAAHAGQKLFVRMRDGQIVSARYESLRP